MYRLLTVFIGLFCMSSWAQPTPPPFREDLDFSHQLVAVRSVQRERRLTGAMEEWRKTNTNRQNHRIMLRLLVIESFRNRDRTPQNLQQLQQLLSKIDQLMKEQDNYVVTLRAINELRLFQSRNDTDPDNPPSGATNPVVTD